VQFLEGLEAVALVRIPLSRCVGSLASMPKQAAHWACTMQALRHKVGTLFHADGRGWTSAHDMVCVVKL